MRNTFSKTLFFATILQSSVCFGGMADISGMVLTPKKPSVFKFSKDAPKIVPAPSEKVLQVSLLDKETDSKNLLLESDIPSSNKIKKSRIIGNMADKSSDIVEKSIYRKEIESIAKKTIAEKLKGFEEKEDVFEKLIAKSKKDRDRSFNKNREVAQAPTENISFSSVFANMSKNRVEDNYDLSLEKLAKKPSSIIKKESNAFISDKLIDGEDLKKELMNNYIAQNRYVSPLTLDDVNRESEKGIHKAITIKEKKNSEGGRLNILQMKLGFTENSAALNGRNINNLRNFAVTVLDNPNQGVKVGISTNSLKNQEAKQIAARRYSIIHKILKEEGVKERNIVPVLTTRPEESFSLNIFDVDNFQTTKKSNGLNIFGEEVDKRYYNTLSW